MSYPRRRVRGSRVVLTLVVLLPLAIAVGTVSPAVTAHAATSSHPACQASRISVTAGATVTTATYRLKTSEGVLQYRAYEVVPVYFYNRGTTCHLLTGAPEVRAVRNTTDPAKLSVRDMSVPTAAENTRRPVITHHQKIEALFVVDRLVGSSFTGCDPATTTGFLVNGYANPIATTHFVVRQLGDVCFDTGVGRNVLNYGAVWPTAQ